MAAVEVEEGNISVAADGRCETASTASEARVLVVEYIMLRSGMEHRFRWIPVEDWEEELLEDILVSGVDGGVVAGGVKEDGSIWWSC